MRKSIKGFDWISGFEQWHEKCGVLRLGEGISRASFKDRKSVCSDFLMSLKHKRTALKSESFLAPIRFQKREKTRKNIDHSTKILLENPAAKLAIFAKKKVVKFETTTENCITISRTYFYERNSMLFRRPFS